MAEAPITVAIIMAAPFPALQGSQVLVQQLAGSLARRGHRVHLVAYGAASGTLPPGVAVHRIPQLWGCRITASGPHPGKVMLDSLLTWKLLGVVRRQGVDVLHAHNYEGAIVSLLVGRMTGRPVVYHGHSAMADELPTYFSSAVGRLLARRVGCWLDAYVPRRADYCIGVTTNLVDVLRACGVSPDGVECVPPGGLELGSTEAQGPPPGWREQLGLGKGPILLYAGNLDGYQNLEFLLRSFARVQAQRRDARLLVVTHGEGRRHRRRARELGHHGVHVLTVRTFARARVLIAAADVAVCPRREATGFPMKLLNYMAAGKAIVACAGSAKMLRHGQTGLVVPNDDEAAFAAAIVALLQDSEARQRLGAAAHRAARAAWGSQTMVDAVEGIYRRVLAGRRTTPRRSVVAAREVRA
jgi:glycosyltransferase involved in cell wall biosynthesis